MDKITQPKVRTLAVGNKFVVKRMEAQAGALLPKHLANVESVLFIHEGEITLRINGEEVSLDRGDAYTIPPDVPHQIQAITSFKGIHVMPHDIAFTFLS